MQEEGGGWKKEKNKMSLEIAQGSSMSIRSEVDYFSSLATEVGVVHSYMQEVYPLNSTKERYAELDYIFEGNSTFIDLPNSLHKVVAQVTQADGTSALPDDEDVTTINNFMHGLYKTDSCRLADFPITRKTDGYDVIAYVNTTLGFGSPYKNTAGQAIMYYQDTKGDDSTSTNIGATARKKRIAKSKEIEMIGPLFLDLAQQNKYILNNVEVRIKLTRNSDDYVLWGPKARASGSSVCPYTVKILSASFLVRRHTLAPSLFNRIQQDLNRKAARYNYDRCEIKSFNILRGLSSGTSDNLFMGQLPQLVVVFMNKSEDLAGKLSTNPYNFRHFNLKKLSLTVDNETVLHRSIEFNFAQNQFLSGYTTLFSAASNRDLGNNITMDDYLNGYFFNVFELGSSSTGDDLQPERRGRLKIDLDFEKALEDTVTVIVFAQYQAYIEIDKNRVVRSSL